MRIQARLANTRVRGHHPRTGHCPVPPRVYASGLTYVAPSALESVTHLHGGVRSPTSDPTTVIPRAVFGAGNLLFAGAPHRTNSGSAAPLVGCSCAEAV